MIPLLFFLIRRYFLRRKNAPGKLFQEALKNENSGQFESALLAYEKALGVANKAGFTRNTLKATIIEKLKILRTVIEYKNSFIAAGK